MSFELPLESPLLSTSFTFGVATASFQIEGATQEDGRCESIWDRFCRTPGKVKNGDTGDLACDHYHRVEEDLDLIQSLGFDAYRFSIAWPRIEPAPGEWNEAGFAFYERIIDGLIARNIKAYVTLYHWDLPQYLEDDGGWLNRTTAERFARYADKVTQRFGNKVTSYATLNEPWCSAFLGYRYGIHAPGIKNNKQSIQAVHHLLLAHGMALPAMRNNAPHAQHGVVLNFTPGYANTQTPADIAATDYYEDENTHLFIQPILEGRYPEAVFEQHADWLPEMHADDLTVIAAPIDFLGINFYSRAVIQQGQTSDYETVNQDAEKTDIGWEIYPPALPDLLTDLKHRYPNLPPIAITENGAADNTEMAEGHVEDVMRERYYERHLNALNEAIEQGVAVNAYFAWSLMDNFEWAEGYSQRFGIVHVNYATQQRTVKRSGKSWQEFLSTRS